MTFHGTEIARLWSVAFGGGNDIRLWAWPHALRSVALAALTAGAGLAAGEISLAPQDCRIVLPEKADPGKQAAARELQKHLQLITGVEIAVVPNGAPTPGIYPFCVGIPAPQDQRPFAPEEARWAVTPEATYLYGDDDKRPGAQFAVYAFLEDGLGVRWLAPGDRWIAYVKQARLTLTTGEWRWAPALEMRSIRSNARPGIYPQKKAYVEEFAAFIPSHETHDRYADDVRTWQKRMRMGSHTQLSYGHAFTGWWDR